MARAVTFAKICPSVSVSGSVIATGLALRWDLPEGNGFGHCRATPKGNDPPTGQTPACPETVRGGKRPVIWRESDRGPRRIVPLRGFLRCASRPCTARKSQKLAQ